MKEELEPVAKVEIETIETIFAAVGKVTFRLNNKGEYIITITVEPNDLSKTAIGDLAELCSLPGGILVSMSDRNYAKELMDLEEEGYKTDLV